MNAHRTYAAAFLLMLLATACSAPLEITPPRQESGARTITVQGTVQFHDLEGGVYTLETWTGQLYNLIGLPAQYRKSGLRLEVTGLVDPETATMHMRGIPLQVEQAVRLSQEERP